MDVTYTLKTLNKDEINIIKEFLKLIEIVCDRCKKSCWGCPFQMRFYNDGDDNEHVCCSLIDFKSISISGLEKLTGEDSLN